MELMLKMLKQRTYHRHQFLIKDFIKTKSLQHIEKCNVPQ